MKNIKILALMGVFCFSTLVSAKEIVTTDLNVRQQPTKESKIIDVLKQGIEIETTSTNNPDWNKIVFEDYTGYVCNSFLATEEKTEPVKQIDQPQEAISIADFQYVGIFSWNGWQWTYYLMSQFPGQTSTPVEGRYVNDRGLVCDKDGYVILASVDLPPYTVMETPLGQMGKVYDTGCPHGIIDIYTNW